MSMAAEKSGGKRKRRRYTAEFKAETVGLVEKTGKSMSEVERDLGLPRSVVSLWVRQARTDAGKGPPGVLTTEEKMEVSRLRKQVRDLELERALLKKWVAYCAKENE
jgi:transposase